MTIVEFLNALQAADEKPAIEKYRDELIAKHGAELTDEQIAVLKSGSHSALSHQILKEESAAGITHKDLVTYNTFMFYPYSPI